MLLGRPAIVRTGALCAFLWLAAGCGGGAEPAGVHRVELTVAVPGARVEPRVLHHLRVPAELEPWSIEAESYELVTPRGELAQGGEAVALFVEPRGEVRVLIPGDFDPGVTDQVAVTLHTERTMFLHARLWRGGEVVGRTIGSIAATNQSSTQVVRLDYPAHTGGAPCEAIEIVLRSYQGGWTLFGIDLIEIPRAARLPQVADGPELIRIGADSRLGLGLATDAPLSGRFHVPRGGRLTLSYGWPPAVSDADRAAAVVARIAGESVGRFSLGSGRPKDAVWFEDRLDLAAFAGEDVTLELALEAEGPEPAICAVGVPIVSSHAPGAAPPPTVVFVTSDTHRFDHVASSNRGVDVRTPVLDELAAGGVTFEDCFATTNVTQPSHIALLTGVGPRDTGVYENMVSITRAAPTLAEHFRDAGYVTFAVVSGRHLGDAHSGLGQGFDRMWAPPGSACDGEVSIDVLERWMGAAEGRPLFVWLHVFDAHAPYAVPEDILAQHYPADRDPEDRALPEPDFPPAPGLAGVRDVEYPRAMYRAEVSYLDQQLGRILGLERVRAGIVAFTADHGEGLGENGVWWTHAGLYPSSLHVPLILRWPGGPEGERVTRPVHHTDLARTLLDLAGLESAVFPGRSLLADGADRPERPRFALASGVREASVTFGGLHLILSLHRHRLASYDGAPEIPLHAVELYDLVRDPGCARDLRAERRADAARLRAVLIEWLLAAELTGWAATSEVDEEMLRSLAELGYTLDLGAADGAALFDADCDCPQCAEFR